MNRPLFFFLFVLWIMLFLMASQRHELPKASAFNTAIHERNDGDERATFYDKLTVKNILKAGCVPVIPKDKNQNITSLCSQS